MRRRLTAVLFTVLLAAGCQPQQPPVIAAPSPSASSPGIALPPPEGTRRYDPAIKPVDETRAARAVTAPRASPPRQPSERERQAIAAWEKEEAATSRTALTVTPPARSRSKLSMPGDTGTLPQPSGEPTPSPRPTGELAIPPSANERPERPATAEAPRPPPPVPPPPVASSPAAVPSVTPPAPAPTPRAEAAAPRPSSAGEAPPARTAAASPEPKRQPPAGPPLTTVIFTPRSANLSDDARVALGFFAQDPSTQRLRRIELWAGSSAEDPADAGRIAFARALAVHAYLIDLGVKANIEIAGYSETGGVSPDRVDIIAPTR